MINPRQAASILRKKHPELTITECVELPNHWLFTAVENPNETDYNDPFYAIEKRSGKVCSYSPFDDIDNFNNAKEADFE